MKHIALAAFFSIPGLAVHADVPDVVTDIPIVHSLVSLVMGELGTPHLLLEQGADAHDFQLRPSQVRALNGAGLIVWIGPEMTPLLDRVLEDAGEVRSLELLHQPGTTIRSFGQNVPDDAEEHDGYDHSHDGSAHAHHADEPDGHHHEGLDPHAWLDPDNAALWIGMISDALVAEDPGNAVSYRANASLAQTRLRALDDAFAETLVGAANSPIVVAHDALGYFADHYGVTVAASLADGDAAAPGAAHLSDIRALLESGEAVCIFPEAGRDPAPVEALADGTAAHIGAPLDPEGRMLPPGPMLYETLLQGLVTSISECVSGT